MEIEIPKWVIQTSTGKKTLNRKTNKMQIEVTEDCLFDLPTEADERLKMMDPGYVINKKRRHMGAQTSHIW